MSVSYDKVVSVGRKFANLQEALEIDCDRRRKERAIAE